VVLDEPKSADRTTDVNGITVLLSPELDLFTGDIIIEYWFIDEIEKLHVVQIK
jgi:hypothetical protein